MAKVELSPSFRSKLKKCLYLITWQITNFNVVKIMYLKIRELQKNERNYRYQDATVNYEALLVQRNAPRWLMTSLPTEYGPLVEGTVQACSRAMPAD